MKKIKIGDLTSYSIFENSENGYPTSAVILLHGYGADGQDLISLGIEWSKKCPDTLFISPDAPYLCEVNPVGRQWFSLAEYTTEAMEKEIKNHWTILSKYIDALMLEYNLSDNQILLSGFSQGCMMALYTALNRQKKCAGILGYSGRLLNNSETVISSHKNLPIHLIHGSADTVVPVDYWHDTMGTLKKNGFEPSGYTSKGLGHGIDSNGVESGLFFIKDVFQI